VTGSRTTGRHLVVEADGGSRGNPGPAGFGALVRDADTGELLDEVMGAIRRATNNVAEYRGLIAGLRAAIALDSRCTVEVRMDSKLVVEQMSGRWAIKHEDMRTLAAQARGIIPQDRVSYTWIPRAQNAHADRLANQAMDDAARGRTRPHRGQEQAAAGQDSAAGPSAAGQDRAGAGPVPDLSQAVTLLFVRHGRTPLTLERRMSGSNGSDPDLSSEGLRDARAVAELLAGPTAPQGPWSLLGHVSAIVSSPMRRTLRTARALADRLGLEPVVDENWIELDFGQWEGLTYEEILRRDPDLLSQWIRTGEGSPPGGESVVHLCERVEAAFAGVLQEFTGRTVAVVTHTTPIRAVVRHVLEASPLALRRTRVDPCSVTVVRAWSDGGVELFTTNHTAHLN
jgi:ribonuclease H / adenosylcobalamin/alpha-ribazole phosphatase